MPASPTLFRRAATTFGAPVRAVLRRVRDRIVGPLRAETDARFAALRHEYEQRDLAARADAAALRCDVQALSDRIDALDAWMRAETGAVVRQARQHEAALGDARAAMAAGLTRLGRQAAGIVAAVAAAQARVARRMDTERDELHGRCLLLEQLLTGTPAARPPGAAEAVARLSSPAVAVIVPTHDRAGFLAEAIASVQAQSFRDWELIVVDDGSTDDTEAVVARLLDDRRIRYVRQQRAGPAAARNRGIAETSAPLIAYLDSDNLWYPDFLARAVDCLATEADVEIAYGALVSATHGLDRRTVLWQSFDRAALLRANYIDTNVIIHRRALVGRFGGWDTALGRLIDWELVLRYTVDKPARALNVLAAYYRDCDSRRITDVVPIGPAMVAIRRKWPPAVMGAQRARVLYAVAQYAGQRTPHIETELRCMVAWGVHVELWRATADATGEAASVPVHDGALGAAVAAVRPDVIHVHASGFGADLPRRLAACGLPVTVRVTVPTPPMAWLVHDWVAAVHAYPDLIADLGIDDARLKPAPIAFDTRLFKPPGGKDARLVVAMAQDRNRDGVAALAARLAGQRLESGIGIPREELAALLGRAGIYVHVAAADDAEPPPDAVLAMVEAMASGCYCVAPDWPSVSGILGDVGAVYRDRDELVGLIRATVDWSEAEWTAVRNRAVERAFQRHADMFVYRDLLDDWIALVADRR